MQAAIMAVTIVSFYFMLAPQDANGRFGVSLRNQNKFLIGTFALYAVLNILKLLTAISLGAIGAGVYAAVFLALDIFLVNLYIKKL